MPMARSADSPAPLVASAREPRVSGGSVRRGAVPASRPAGRSAAAPGPADGGRPSGRRSERRSGDDSARRSGAAASDRAGAGPGADSGSPNRSPGRSSNVVVASSGGPACAVGSDASLGPVRPGSPAAVAGSPSETPAGSSGVDRASPGGAAASAGAADASDGGASAFVSAPRTSVRAARADGWRRGRASLAEVVGGVVWGVVGTVGPGPRPVTLFFGSSRRALRSPGSSPVQRPRPRGRRARPGGP